ncbi:histidine phosphatase family protein [Photobacterium kasasachensis]|uniref:histidine phosphatase family protein n=1 Tax=Photobacterium kasasachensis TaxID=2910240 RepID=UPI003D09A077
MKLILLRHGQTQWNLTNKLQGWRDSSLTPQAKRQLSAMSPALIKSDVIYSSDLGRAQSTARIIANISRTHIITDTRLRERCFGALEGKQVLDSVSGGTFWHGYHQRYQAKMTSVPGVEKEQQFEQRINSWLSDITARHYGNTVLVVSHGEWLRALQNIILGKLSWQQGNGILSNGEPLAIRLAESVERNTILHCD